MVVKMNLKMGEEEILLDFSSNAESYRAALRHMQVMGEMFDAPLLRAAIEEPSTPLRSDPQIEEEQRLCRRCNTFYLSSTNPEFRNMCKICKEEVQASMKIEPVKEEEPKKHGRPKKTEEQEAKEIKEYAAELVRKNKLIHSATEIVKKFTVAEEDTVVSEKQQGPIKQEHPMCDYCEDLLVTKEELQITICIACQRKPELEEEAANRRHALTLRH